MKKLVLSFAALCMAVSLNAQSLITSHFEGAISDPSPANWNVGYYAYNSGNGYVSGTNAYGDQAVLQRFDATHGLTGAGTINAVSLLVTGYEDSGNGETVTIGVWADNAGVPGALLGSQSIALTAIDTSGTGLYAFPAAPPYKAIFNVNAIFSTPIAIPANLSFFAGITVPDGANGDTLIITTTTPPYSFADASTHAGTLNSANGFDGYGLALANAIFPTVTYSSTASLNENVITTSVYPNPANDVLNIVSSEEIATVSIVGLDGKIVAKSETSAVNVSELNSGMYIYEVTTVSGKVSRDSFMKK
jgi:hypothetical protein